MRAKNEEQTIDHLAVQMYMTVRADSKHFKGNVGNMN